MTAPRGELTLFIGKQTRSFSWGLQEVLVIEDVMKMGIAAILSGEQLGIRTICVALMAGYLHVDRKLTPARVAKWISEGVQTVDRLTGERKDIDAGDLLILVATALGATMPPRPDAATGEGDDAGPPKAPPTTSTGA